MKKIKIIAHHDHGKTTVTNGALGGVIGYRLSAMQWYDYMSCEDWTKIEKKYGYHGHDIGTTESDIIEMYKMEHGYR